MKMKIIIIIYHKIKKTNKNLMKFQFKKKCRKDVKKKILNKMKIIIMFLTMKMNKIQIQIIKIKMMKISKVLLSRKGELEMIKVIEIIHVVVENLIYHILHYIHILNRNIIIKHLKVHLYLPIQLRFYKKIKSK